MQEGKKKERWRDVREKDEERERFFGAFEKRTVKSGTIFDRWSECGFSY